jgi:hypothetical protein
LIDDGPQRAFAFALDGMVDLSLCEAVVKQDCCRKQM